jgi:hypothetical protein
VEIGSGLPGLDFFDTNALGMVQEVTGNIVVVKVFTTFEPIERFHVARITSVRPARRGQSSTPGDASPTVTFDELKQGDQSSDALARYGITAIRTNENHPLVYAAAESQVLPAERKNVISAGTVSTRMSTLTFTFARPLRRFEIVRIGVIRGGSLPKWRMEALDGEGNVVDATGEGDWGFDANPKRFSVAGRGIVSVRIEADNRWGDLTFASYSALPIVELRLEEDSRAPGAPPLGPWRPDRSAPNAAGGRENVLFSDSFDRADAEGAELGQADLSLGGSGRHSYLPIWPSSVAGRPIGARIVNNALENNGGDFGGVQFAAAAAPRGENLGQDLNINVDLLVPTDAAGHVTQAGPYFRSRAADRGNGLIGGQSAGYWVQLHSTGEVKVKRLNPVATVAVSEKPAQFDAGIFHALAVAVQGDRLQVTLDGRLVTFRQNGNVVSTVSVPATWQGPPAVGFNDGAAGIIFSAEDHRGRIGGQRADNLVVSGFHSLIDATPTGSESRVGDAQVDNSQGGDNLNIDGTRATIRIPADKIWTETGLLLRAGDTLTITASGTVEAAGPTEKRAFYHAVSPNGREERLDYLPDRDLPALSLVGMYGDVQPVFFVGESLRMTIGAGKGEGYLRLAINDDDVSDNQGAWLVQITIDRGTGPAEEQPTTRAEPPGGGNDSTDAFDEDLEAL